MTPNVLLLYTDQQRWDALAANGNPDIQTPNLDRLAASGMNYDHCFVQHPVCMPSRLSLLTGRYPSAANVAEMGVPVPEDLPHFATYFKRAGYATAQIGKLHFLPHSNRDHTLPHPSYDFDHLEISDEPGVYEDAYYGWLRQKAPDQLKFISPGLPPSRAIWKRMIGGRDPIQHPPSEGEGRFDFDGPVAFTGRDDCTHTAFVGTRTCDYLRSRRNLSQPFACIAGFYSPHSPWRVPQKYLDRYDPESLALSNDATESFEGRPPFDADHLRRARHGYYAMVTEVDDWIGEILDTLEATGQRDSTLIAFTSDHGEWLGEFGLWGKGPPAFDACSRVPLIVAGPGIEPGSSSELTEAVDLLPTLIEQAGLVVSSELQGLMLPGVGRASEPRTSAMTELPEGRSLRLSDHRYVVDRAGKERLYAIGDHQTDLADDPAHASVLADCRHEMVARLLQSQVAKPRTWTY